MVKKVFVPGGAGYKGAVLVPKLLAAGYEVTVLDWFLYGENVLLPHPHLRQVKGDVRDTALVRTLMAGCDAVIHLACISNDPSVELDPALSQTVNFESFRPLLQISKEAGVQRFIFASSSSIYGVSEAPEVTEEHPHVPVSLYNTYKSMCEEVLWEEQTPDFVVTAVRPATVCGYSSRQRLDLTVNILTNHAVNRGVITVFGGAQMRPNIHIEDITDLYVELLTAPAEKIAGQAFNAGYENHAVADLAWQVKTEVERLMPRRAPVGVETQPSNDIRSYHISSQKLTAVLGWQPQRTVTRAIQDMVIAFDAGKLPDSLTDVRYFNIQMMQQHAAALLTPVS